MLAFVFLAAFIAAFFAPAAFAVPTSTNTGLSPRETVGQYKFYLNADQFTASAFEFSTLLIHLQTLIPLLFCLRSADGIDQAPTLVIYCAAVLLYVDCTTT